MNLTKDDYVRSIMYVKEIGDLIALYQKDGKKYFACWAGHEELNTVQGDVYVAVEVTDEIVADYLAKRINGYDIQKNSPNVFIGMYTDRVLELVIYSFAQAVANEHTMTEGTSFYDESLADVPC